MSARLALSLDPRDARARDRSTAYEQRLRDLLAPQLVLERGDTGTSECPGSGEAVKESIQDDRFKFPGD